MSEQDQDKLEGELKELIIESLQLEDISADEIDSDMVLFGDGLGLDSVDALELGVSLNKQYGVKIKSDSEETKEHFASIRNLAKFVAAERGLASA